MSAGDTADIVVPSESFEGTRSRLVRWLKSAGQPVVLGEPLIEVETDKVTVEIPSPATGVLAETLKAPEDELAVGDLLGRIGLGASSQPATPPSAAARPARAAPAFATRAGTAPAADAGAASLSPAVRRLLAQHGLEAAQVVGTGAGARVSVDDVLRHVAAHGSDGAAPGVRESSGVRRVPHSPARRRIAERMVESLLRTAPHVTTVFEADLGAILAHRERHKDEFAAAGVPLTLSAYFVQALVPAIRAVPEANARWSSDAIEVLERIDVGVATAVEGKGLFVPVIRDVASRDLRSIAAALKDLTTRARAEQLMPADVRDGTFTISNHGVSGSVLAAPIVIPQPQVAILGVGRLEKRAVVVEEGSRDAIVVRPRCYVTLTLDHRVMDGHQANHFLATWVGAVEGFRD
jgi:2-oxoglutarate dehydrogenase E2 component (dihydrolipoamide succinyltransferase)